MFVISNPVKTEDQSGYMVTSKPCPMCNETVEIQISSAKMFAYHQGGFIHDVLSEFEPAIRERFQSGICESCWFPDED